MELTITALKARRIVKALDDGTIYVMPNGKHIFQIDKTNKRLFLLRGSKDSVDFKHAQESFAHIGYYIIDGELI